MAASEGLDEIPVAEPPAQLKAEPDAMADGGDGGGVPGSRISVMVTDPKKEQEGINAYVSYKVVTRSDMPGFAPEKFVIRRYSDFVWLHGQLELEVPGAIVPPLPEKAVVGRFTPEFIEGRRRALEKFVVRACKRPELVKAKCVQLFLQVDDLAVSKTEQKAAAAATKQANSAAAGGKAGFFGWFEEKASDAVSTLQVTLAESGSAIKSRADQRIEEIVTYINNLEVQMANVAKHTSGLMKRNRDLANGLFEFGLSFTLLAQTETDQLAGALTHLGHTADQLSLLVAQQAERESIAFEEPIHDYIRMLSAVKSALAARTRAKNELAAAQAALEAKKAACAKLVGQPGKEDKVAAAEAAVEAAQAAVDRTRDMFEEVSARVVTEMDHFKREKAGEMQALILDYAQMQIAYNQRLEQQWQQLVPKLEALHGPEGAAEGAAAAAAVVQNGPLPTLERRMSGDRALPGLPAAPLGGPPAPSRDSASAPLPPPPADGDDSEDVVGV